MRQWVPRRTRVLRWVVLPILLAGAAGCGSRATVTGKVTYQGRPVVYGSVIVLSADKTARSGVIEPDGSYTVEGVAPGDVKVAVLSHDPAKGRSVLRGERTSHLGRKGAAAAKAAVKGWFPLPRKFEDPETSGYGSTVGTGRVRYDIELR
jgi:hypothetical protein